MKKTKKLKRQRKALKKEGRVSTWPAVTSRLHLIIYINLHQVEIITMWKVGRAITQPMPHPYMSAFYKGSERIQGKKEQKKNAYYGLHSQFQIK